MAAVPDWAEGRQVARHELFHLLRREGGAAFQHDAADLRRIAVRELDRDGGTGVTAEEGCALQAQGVHHLLERIGIVGDLRPVQLQRIGAAIPGRVGRDDGKGLGQRLDHGNERRRRAGRFMEQHDRRAAAGAAHHDPASTANDETMLDRVGAAAHAPVSLSTRFSTLPPGLRGSASMKSTSLGTLKPARFSLP